MDGRRPLALSLVSVLILLNGTVSPGSPARAGSAPFVAPARVRPYQGDPPEMDGWPRVARIDFGPVTRPAPRSWVFDRSHPIRGAAWLGGIVRREDRAGTRDSFLGDLVRGVDATFEMRVDTLIAYKATLTLGDLTRPQGPVDVIVNGTQVIGRVATRPGEFVDVPFSFASADGRLRVRLVTRDCDTFAANGLTLYEARPDSGTTPIWRPVADPPRLGPQALSADPQDLPAPSSNLARAVLRRACRYLMAQRPAAGCFTYSGNWYENSFALRTILAGAALLHEDEYRESAFACLDQFTEDQEADGTWRSQYFGRLGCPPDSAIVVTANRSANLADVGSMALCLAVAAPAADEERRTRYLAAARRYADAIVLPNQLPNGAFPNLQYEGKTFTTPYSVATGVQATNLAALYGATGDTIYLRAAERAAIFLAVSLEASGEILFHSHDREGGNVTPSGVLGDHFYLIEGMLWVCRYGNPDVQRILRETLTLYLLGPKGLHLWLEDPTWWAPENAWESSKRAGVLYLLAQYASIPDADERVKPLVSLAFARLAYAKNGLPFGILGDPAEPEGGFALVATGFFGLGQASVLSPAIVYPR